MVEGQSLGVQCSLHKSHITRAKDEQKKAIKNTKTDKIVYLTIPKCITDQSMQQLTTDPSLWVSFLI